MDCLHIIIFSCPHFSSSLLLIMTHSSHAIHTQGVNHQYHSYHHQEFIKPINNTRFKPVIHSHIHLTDINKMKTHSSKIMIKYISKVGVNLLVINCLSLRRTKNEYRIILKRNLLISFLLKYENNSQYFLLLNQNFSEHLKSSR